MSGMAMAAGIAKTTKKLMFFCRFWVYAAFQQLREGAAQTGFGGDKNLDKPVVVG